MIKGFLGYGDTQAYTVYGAYTALVYMTPFIGGMLADKYLGKRLAVVLGGLLMAAGHLLMTWEAEWPFFFALALLISGNGFFKPNISTTVGELYAKGSKKRDDGFNIFYTGINLGAAISPLLCGYVGETFGWHYGFGLATIGMLVGLAVFVMPNLITQVLIMSAALASSVGLLVFRPDNIYAILINIFVAACLMIAAVVAWIALSRGGLPKWAGGRPEGADSRHDWKIYLGTAISIPIFALLVSGFSPFMPATGDVTTKEEMLKERVLFLQKLNVDQGTIDKVKAAGITVEPQQRGESYQLINKKTIAAVKGEVDEDAVKSFFNKQLEGLTPSNDFKALDVSAVKKDDLLRALELEFGANFGGDSDVLAQFNSIDSVVDAAVSSIEGGDNAAVEEFVKKQLKSELEAGSFAALGVSPEKKTEILAALEKQFSVSFPKEKLDEISSIDGTISAMNSSRSTFAGTIAGIFVEEVSKPAGLVLTVLGILAFGYLILETFRLKKIQRERMIAALILIFFQMLFFAFFEQAGSSVNNFTDRNIDRVGETVAVTEDKIGKTIKVEPTQAQLGYVYNDAGAAFTNDDLDELRKIIKETKDLDKIEVDWKVSEKNVGMGVATRLDELPASIFQSFNAIFILIFALIFNWIWSTLRARGLDPSAPVKFGLGLIQLGLGFGAFWFGAQNCTDVGMVAITWLTIGILLQTTGELCLSPVGLSTMTKLSPKALMSTLMGAWFLATAFSQYLAAIISQFTSVDSGGGGDLPAPINTVNVYGDVFGSIALTAMACGAICILMSPLLKYWMHENVEVDDDGNVIETKS
jgi:POT family proton-dependent oligopeptide transporter